MTTIQDRIIEKTLEWFQKYRVGFTPTSVDELKNIISDSIKEVEEETRNEIIKNINTHKTLVAVADGNKYFEVMSIGNIIVKPIKNIGNGASYKQVIYDESISIINKKDKK